MKKYYVMFESATGAVAASFSRSNGVLGNVEIPTGYEVMETDCTHPVSEKMNWVDVESKTIKEFTEEEQIARIERDHPPESSTARVDIHKEVDIK